MQKTPVNFYNRDKREKGLIEKRRINYAKFFGRVLCGLASGYVFLILFVLALDISNMTFGRIGHIGNQVSVGFPVPLTPHGIALWNTRVETLELTKIIAALSFFAMSSAISTIIFLQIKNIYNVFFIIGLEYLPIPFIGNYLQAQGSALYLMMFFIGVCIICYSAVLKRLYKQGGYDFSQSPRNSFLEQDYDSCYVRHKGR
ncbi:MAG: hypothetical protein ACUZ77_08575 [Candidatus Brocadiales bacterium]